MITALSNVPTGNICRVFQLKSKGDTLQRLQDLGLVPGTVVRVLHKAPSGDPTAYMIRGAVIALRREDAALIHVKH